MKGYVHGYSHAEANRLKDQANTLAGLLYGDLRYPAGSTVLEAGCGTGCQTIQLAAANPHTCFVCLDIAPDSLRAAKQAMTGQGNVRFQLGDIHAPPFAAGHFDHLFVCFVLEHLTDPVGALAALRRVLKPGGTITVIEGDHGSFFCHPHTSAAQRTVDCLIQLQSGLGGDALIGRRLYPLLNQAGYTQPHIEPRLVYVDGSRPELVEGFSHRTFIAMVEGVREQAIAQKLIEQTVWDQGIHALQRATEPDGVFCYTFFRALARNIG